MQVRAISTQKENAPIIAGNLKKSVVLKIFTSLKHFHYLPDESAIPFSSCRSLNSDYLHMASNSKWLQMELRGLFQKPEKMRGEREKKK